MKITLEKLLGSADALKNLFNSEVPVTMAFKLSKTIKDAEENIKLFEESRLKLLKQYGEETSEDSYKISEENAPLIQKELDELLKTEVELTAEPLSVDKLGDIKMTSADVYALSWLFTD